jgi:hypothetical protein
MRLRKTPNPAFTKDDPPIVHSLRYATEPPPKPWGSVLTGCLMQGLVFGILFAASFASSPGPGRQDDGRVTTLVPAPRGADRREQLPPERKTLSPAPGAARPKREDPSDPPPVEDRVDMNSIEISIADDNTNQLPEVVRQQQGILALVDREDQSIAHYTFEPPDWRMRDRMVDVSGRIRFSMTPPTRWALLQTLADRHSIAIEKYQVDALFDIAYTSCLEREIRKQADASPQRGRVRAAVLVFTSSRSCGIDVVDLKFTGQ